MSALISSNTWAETLLLRPTPVCMWQRNPLRLNALPSYKDLWTSLRYRSSFETVHVRSSQSVYSPKTTMAQTANKLLILMILYYHDNPLYCAIVAPLPRSPALQHVWKLVAQQICLCAVSPSGLGPDIMWLVPKVHALDDRHSCVPLRQLSHPHLGGADWNLTWQQGGRAYSSIDNTEKMLK